MLSSGIAERCSGIKPFYVMEILERDYYQLFTRPLFCGFSPLPRHILCFF